MEKLHKAGQITKTILVSVLLMVIPFISASMRTSYLYFLLNILILVLACESGILQVGSLPDPNSSDQEKKRATAPTASSQYPWLSSQGHLQNHPSTSTTTNYTCANIGSFLLNKQPVLVPAAEDPTTVLVDKAVVVAETKKTPAARVQKKQQQQPRMKRCPSLPSLFFIGSCDDDNVDEECYYDPQEEHPTDEEEEEEMVNSVAFLHADDVLTGQELFCRAETFIGNFYKQLKMQREESWKKLHGLYQKP